MTKLASKITNDHSHYITIWIDSKNLSEIPLVGSRGFTHRSVLCGACSQVCGVTRHWVGALTEGVFVFTHPEVVEIEGGPGGKNLAFRVRPSLYQWGLDTWLQSLHLSSECNTLLLGVLQERDAGST